jgi:transposase
MSIVETISKIRYAHHRDGKSIRQISRDYRLSKNTVKKIIHSGVTELVYRRDAQPRPKLGAFEERLSERLLADQQLSRREQRTAYNLFELVAYTPAAGWEKGQVENQVDFHRQRFFVPRRKFADLEELNRYLTDQCRMLAAGHKHPEFPDRTVADLFAEERKHLMTVQVPFDGYREEVARISSTSLVLFERNRYSVHASSVGKSATERVYADQLVLVADDKVVGTHPRLFGRDKTGYDPWHYVEAIQYKPGALRNGAPFKGWELPEPLQAVRTALSAHTDGDRQFVGILCVVLTYGLDEVTDACAAGIIAGTISKDVILSLLARKGDGVPATTCDLPPQLPVLRLPPIADCCRYDRLLTGGALAT